MHEGSTATCSVLAQLLLTGPCRVGNVGITSALFGSGLFRKYSCRKASLGEGGRRRRRKGTSDSNHDNQYTSNKHYASVSALLPESEMPEDTYTSQINRKYIL